MTHRDLALGIAAALLLALAGLALAAWTAWKHQATRRELAAYRDEVTELIRHRNRDRHDLNQLHRWAHGADPDPGPDWLPDPQTREPTPAPDGPWIDPAAAGDPPDRRRADRRHTGAHRTPFPARRPEPPPPPRGKAPEMPTQALSASVRPEPRPDGH